MATTQKYSERQDDNVRPLHNGVNQLLADEVNESAPPEEPTIEEKLRAVELRLEDDIQEPVTCIEICKGLQSVPICTLGNITTLTGRAKHGKTFLMTLLLAAALMSGFTFQEMFNAFLLGDKKVCILFDTEQHDGHVKLILKRICTMIGCEVHPKYLHIYPLREKSPVERLEFIEMAIYNTPNLGFVVIDGIKDLVTSINDEEQASMITSKLLKWTAELNIHIVTVIHQNKNDENARGHLGTELINKSETVISVKKSPENKSMVVVKPENCRGREFEPFAFQIDEHGIPSLLSNWIDGSGDANGIKKELFNKKLEPFEIDKADHVNFVRDIFAIQSEMRWAELKLHTSAYLSRKYNQSFSVRLTETWIGHWIQLNLIIRTGKEKSSASKYKSTLTELN